MFRKLKEGELTGKPNKPKEVCYVAIYSLWAELCEETIMRIINNGGINVCLDNVKAYSNEIDAENAVLKSIKKCVKRGFCTELVTSRYDEKHEKKYLNKNAYWIFIVEGKPDHITHLLAHYDQKLVGSRVSHKESASNMLFAYDPKGRWKGTSYKEFGPKVLSAINKENNILIVGKEVRENMKLKF